LLFIRTLFIVLFLFKVLAIIKSIWFYMISFLFKTISVKLLRHFFRFLPEHCFNTLILLLKFNLPFLYIITLYYIYILDNDFIIFFYDGSQSGKFLNSPTREFFFRPTNKTLLPLPWNP